MPKFSYRRFANDRTVEAEEVEFTATHVIFREAYTDRIILAERAEQVNELREEKEDAE